MTKPLWAPWRLEYVTQADEDRGCVFCAEAEGRLDARESLVVHRGARVLALLNKFPYSSGHLLVAPLRHLSRFEELDDGEAVALHRSAAAGMAALDAVYGPQGFNLGWNLGRVAGAGILDHLHQHVVPRWGGDTNFMPVLADVKVLPEHLRESRDKLAAAWPA